jgi:hypothetical protein
MITILHTKEVRKPGMHLLVQSPNVPLIQNNTIVLQIKLKSTVPKGTVSKNRQVVPWVTPAKPNFFLNISF